MQRTTSTLDLEYLARVGAAVTVCTLVLTAAFLGAVALVTGEATGAGTRLPLYVLVAAGAFVGGVVLIEESRHGGRTTLAAAGTIGVVAFALVGLAAEGALFAASDPSTALGSQLVFYLLATALVGTGLGYWAVHHWGTVRRRVVADGL